MKSGIILLSLLLVSCAKYSIRDPFSYKSNEFHPDIFNEAIKTNNPVNLIKALSKRSFLTKSPLGTENKLRKDKDSAYKRLDTAITGISGKLRLGSPIICRTEIIKALFDAGLKPRKIDLVNTALIPCPDILQVILSKLDKKEITSAIPIFENEFKRRLNSNLIRMNIPDIWVRIFSLISIHADSNQRKALKNTLAMFKTFIENQDTEKLNKFEKLEKRHGIKFCKPDKLFEVIYFNKELNNNCMYILVGSLRVLDTTPKGVMVHLAASFTQVEDKVFFVKTNQRYVKDQPIKPILLKVNGTFSYKTKSDHLRTIYSFQMIDEYSL
jgi:hypothetical protein